MAIKALGPRSKNTSILIKIEVKHLFMIETKLNWYYFTKIFDLTENDIRTLKKFQGTLDEHY